MAGSVIACRVASYGDFAALAYEHLSGLGVKCVEIPVPAPDNIESTKAELERFGLSASTLHGECDVARADIAAAIRAQMPAFAALGTRYMFVSVKAGDTPLETAYQRLREAGDVAGENGVTIVLETHPDLLTNGEVGRRTMEAVAHPQVRVNFDTANVYFYNRDVDAVDELRQVAEFVGAVHLKDTDGGYRHWYFPALGTGVVKFPEIFAVLDDVGFAGPCTLEIEGIEGETPTERLVCERVAASADYLRGLGRL
ncbi:MAG: sugar phosphate isomerase/epimerase [Planctomycetes bacterium]|nr:sugar phosphate isomerase/epimerase [Planctomycetota bacterium]